ncbi:MAG: hypothetical protein OEV45_01775 [Desulfobacteraceae bacterium]|nr:hypothetical protein [Desulfobacteraceae bacterium]
MATMAMSGVAVFKPIIIARSGIANMASANPNVDRSKVAKETMDNTRIVDGSKFIVTLKYRNAPTIIMYNLSFDDTSSNNLWTWNKISVGSVRF